MSTRRVWPLAARYSSEQLVAEAHLLQHGELDLEELDRRATYGDLRLGDDRRGEQRHRLDRVLARRVVDVHVDDRLAGDGQRRRTDALDPHAERLQVEAQVLDHVVGRRVADDGGAGVQRSGHQCVLGHGVAALGEHDRPAGDDRPVDLAVVPAVGRLDLEAERAQRRHVRLDRAGAEVAAAGVGELERLGAVEQRAEEHQHRAGTPRGHLVDPGEVELLRRDDLEVVLVVDPPGLHAEAAEHLEQPVDLLDPGDLAERGATAVEQGGAEQRDTGVLRGLDVDGAGQGGRALDPQVGRAGAEGDDLGVERASRSGPASPGRGSGGPSRSG